MASRVDQEQIEQRARECLRKQNAGIKPSKSEEAALRVLRGQREEAERWKHYASIPKKHYVQMSGRQHKILDEQCSRYGIPIRGETVDLGRVLVWLHDFLAENGPLLLRTVGSDQLLSGELADSPALEKLREVTFRLKELEYKERKGNLIPREEIHDAFQQFANRIRSAGDQLQRKFGPDALEILNSAIDAAEEVALGTGEEAEESHTEAQGHKGEEDGRRSQSQATDQ